MTRLKNGIQKRIRRRNQKDFTNPYIMNLMIILILILRNDASEKSLFISEETLRKHVKMQQN